MADASYREWKTGHPNSMGAPFFVRIAISRSEEKTQKAPFLRMEPLSCAEDRGFSE